MLVARRWREDEKVGITLAVNNNSEIMSATDAGNTGSSSQSKPAEEVPAGFERWRQSLARFTGMGLSDEERAERAKYDEQVKLATDWDRCEKWKAELMTRSE